MGNEWEKGYAEQRAWLDGKSLPEAQQALEARVATLAPGAYNDAGTQATRDYIGHLNLPGRERDHPLFRQGYSLGFSDAARERHPAETGASGLRNSASPPPPSYGINAGGLRDQLKPGTRVARELAGASGRQFTTEVPCCGRRLTVGTPGDDETRPAFCCHCGVTYAVALVEEEPDGYGDEPLKIAVFVVENTGVAGAQHRAGKWEPRVSRGGVPRG